MKKSRRKHSSLWDTLVQQFLPAFLSLELDSSFLVVEVLSDPGKQVA